MGPPGEAAQAAPRAPSWEQIEELLSGASAEAPGVHTLYRAMLCSRQQAPSVGAAIGLLARALRLRDPSADQPVFRSVLLRHEFCYVLGQLGADCPEEAGRREAYACLYEVLLDEREDEVTRHEAAEGIAAVHGGASGSGGGAVAEEEAGDVQASEMFLTLERLSKERGGRGPLAETCLLAVEGIRRKNSRRVCACQYASHDPAIGDLDAAPGDIPRYSERLRQEGADLFERYVALFTLRNLGAAEELARALAEDRSSPVLRHELAFVLGQMDSPGAVEALSRSLRDVEEHVMVRHEAAIALGTIGGEPAKAALRELAADPEPMVAESCVVALDTAAYWEAWEHLEERMRQQDVAS